MNLFDNNYGAEFSNCGKYRYKLWRIWNEDLPKVMCIGLNPSTANADKDDQTIILLRKVLTTLGFGGFYMTNLFGLISPKPNDLLFSKNPVGDNDRALVEVSQITSDVIFAWGAFKQATLRSPQVELMFPSAKCFGKNKNGTPFHPRALVYIKGAVNSPQLLKY